MNIYTLQWHAMKQVSCLLSLTWIPLCVMGDKRLLASPSRKPVFPRKGEINHVVSVSLTSQGTVRCSCGDGEGGFLLLTTHSCPFQKPAIVSRSQGYCVEFVNSINDGPFTTIRSFKNISTFPFTGSDSVSIKNYPGLIPCCIFIAITTNDELFWSNRQISQKLLKENKFWRNLIQWLKVFSVHFVRIKLIRRGFCDVTYI